MSWTVFWAPATYENQNHALNEQQNWFTLLDFIGIFYQAFNVLFLIFDLHYVVKYPFADKAKVMRIYKVLGFTFAFICSFSFYSSSKDYRMNNNVFLLYVILYLGIALSGVFTSIFSIKGLLKNGTPSVIRKLVIKRHLSQIIIYLACNLYVCVTSLIRFMALGSRFNMASVFFITLKALFYSQFIVGPLVRFAEPAFMIALKH